MTTSNLGRVAIVPKGTWVAGTYKALDLVRYNGSSYIAKLTTAALPTDATAWTLLVVDGQAQYMWIKYADDASGTGLSSSPTGKPYLGIAVNKTTSTASTTPADYTWSLINTTQISSVSLTLSTTGTDITTSTTGTTTPVITLNIPTASAANRGALSSADWTTFNGKYTAGGALGTPATGTLTNCTGYTYANLSGTVPTWNQNTSGTAAGLSSTLAVGSGGTGATTLTLNSVLLGNGTGALQVVAPSTSGNVLTSNGTTWVSSTPVVSLPTQTGNTGKYLTTDGTTAAWSTISSGLASTPVKTAAYTAAAYELVRVNTTTGAFTVTLPASPIDGAQVGVIDIAKTFGSFPLTLAPGVGATIEGDSTSMLLDVSGAYVAFVYTTSLTNWRLLTIPLTPNGIISNGGLSPTTVKTANYSTSGNELVRCNTTSGAFSVTMPAAPLDGAIIGFVDINNTFATNNVTILPAGKTIEGSAVSYVLTTNGMYASFVYNSTTSNWKILQAPVSAPTQSIGKTIAMSIAFGG